MQSLKMEWVQTQARKYKMMSKQKSASQRVKGADSAVKEEELMKLTKAKSQQEAEIKLVRANITKLEK